MKKKIVKLPLTELGGNLKSTINSQIVIVRIERDKMMVQNTDAFNDSDFNLKLDPEANRLTITIDNFKLNDAIVLYDDAGMAEKKVIHEQHHSDVQGGQLPSRQET